MAMLSTLGYFMPIFSFLLVFVIIYAVLVKTNILGDNNFVSVLISFILSAFFIFNASLVEFIRVSSAWIVVFIVCLFFMLVLITFGAGKLPEVLNKNLAYAILGVLLIIFVVSSAYVFNWAINWDVIKNWSQTSWFGFVLLLVMAGIVAKVITK